MERDFRRRSYPDEHSGAGPKACVRHYEKAGPLSRAAWQASIALVATSGGAQTDEQKFYREQFAQLTRNDYSMHSRCGIDATQKQDLRERSHRGTIACGNW